MTQTTWNFAEARHLAIFLREQINSLGAEYSDRKRWTTAVQRAFADYIATSGWTNNPEVLPPIDPEFPEESRKSSFLLDFVVWRRDLDGNKEGAWIACESEWNLDSKSIIEDFQKLLSFRAPYKVMIYDVKRKPRLSEDCRYEFEKCISGFQWHLKDEIYIFLEFVDGNGIANIYTCIPSEKKTLTLLV